MKSTLKKCRRALSVILCVLMIAGMVPAASFAGISSDNDWMAFDPNRPVPETEEQLVQEMMRSEGFCDRWGALAHKFNPGPVIEQLKKKGSLEYPSPIEGLKKGPEYFGYTAKGEKDAIKHCTREIREDVRNKADVLGGFSDEEKPVYYLYSPSYKHIPQGEAGLTSHPADLYANTILLISDISIEGKPESFVTPELKKGDTLEELKSKGYSFLKGGSSDSYSVSAENPNDFENKVQKAYSYEKSTSTSTTVETTYSKTWTEETTVGVNFTIPLLKDLLAPKGTVEQSFSYSYGIDKTYSSTKEQEFTQNITDTIEVPLPPHTSLKIDVNVDDQTVSIPYSGEARLKFKIKFVYVGGGFNGSYGPWGNKTVYSFGGNKAETAVDDLELRYNNRDITNYDPEGISANKYESASNIIKKTTSANPVAPYNGDFFFKTKETIISPRKVQPLYPLDRITPENTDDTVLYEQQSKRLDSIRINAYNQYDVPYYGFNQRTDGKWTVVDKGGNEDTEYTEITTDRNGYPVVKALKPADGKELYLRYDPDKIAHKTAGFHSDTIALSIKPVKLSDVKIEGSFEPIILNDQKNSTDTSALTVTAADENGKPFDTAGKVKWYAETADGKYADGITVNETTGKIDFTKPGTYQIYAVVNEKESNRVSLEVLPAREVETVQISGEIPDVYFNDGNNNFNLSGLTTEVLDQYGDVFTGGTRQWKVSPSENSEASISGNILTVNKDGLFSISYNVNGVESNILTLKVWPERKINRLEVTGKIPELYYDDNSNNTFDLMGGNLTVNAIDQYNKVFTTDSSKFEWIIEPESGSAAHSSVTGNILTGNVVGKDKLYAQYPTGEVDSEGKPVYVKSEVLNVNVSAKPRPTELFQFGEAPMGREGEAYPLSNIVLKAKDHLGNEFPVPDDIKWSIDNGSDGTASKGATIDNRGNLTVAADTIAYGGTAEVILKASSAKAGIEAKNISVRFRQKPVVHEMTVTAVKPFDLGKGENGFIADYFKAEGKDQYGEAIEVNPEWCLKENKDFAIDNRSKTIRVINEDAGDSVYAKLDNDINVTVTSNEIPISVGAPRRVTSCEISEIPLFVKYGSELDLSEIGVKVFDQYKNEFTQDELAEYPAEIRWTLNKGNTEAQIDDKEDIVSFGNERGKVELICAIVNTKGTFEFTAKQVDIYVGEHIAEFTPETFNLPAKGGSVTFIYKGENLSPVEIVETSATSAEAAIKGTTKGSEKQQKVTLTFPENKNTGDKIYTVSTPFKNDNAVSSIVVIGTDSDTEPTPRPSQPSGGGSAFIEPPAADNEVIKNPDGSVTETEKKDDGTVISTTTKPNGDVTKKEEKPDGSMKSVEERKDGVKIETKRTAEGETTSDITVPKGKKDVDVTIPADNLKPGEVAVIVKPDGTEEIVKNAVSDENGMNLKLDGDAKIKIVDNSKEFNDVENGHWAKDAIGFVTSREIFDGVAENQFAPEDTMTRAMLVKVLHNFENNPEGTASADFDDIDEGIWYADAVKWAVEKGIITGMDENEFAPDAEVTREQMAVILHRYAGLPEAKGDITSFEDASSVSSYAADAFSWATGEGIMNGVGGNLLDPQGSATRAQVAAIMMRLCEKGL